MILIAEYGGGVIEKYYDAHDHLQKRERYLWKNIKTDSGDELVGDFTTRIDAFKHFQNKQNGEKFKFTSTHIDFEQKKISEMQNIRRLKV